MEPPDALRVDISAVLLCKSADYNFNAWFCIGMLREIAIVGCNHNESLLLKLRMAEL